MATQNYDDALARVLAHEGGYTDDPADPGGPTNFGITIADYRKYVKPGASAADVKAMALAQAKAIYRAAYWNALRCDELPSGLDYAMFDYGVNSGTARAAKVLQRLVGLADDGRMTDAVPAAVAQRDPSDLVARLCDERLAFLKQLKTWPVFGNGWSRRVAEVRTAALALAKSVPALATRSGKNVTAPGRAVVPANKPAQHATAGGIAAAGAAAAQLAHQFGARPSLVIAIVLVAIALAVAGWLGWRWWQKRQQQRPITGEQP